MDISTISTRDYIYITADYLSLLRGEKENHDELLKRGFTLEQIKNATKNQVNSEVTIGGLKFTRPLTSFKYEYMGFVLLLLENYEKGNLPFPGSVTEQPGQIMDILNVVQNIKIEFQRSLEKQHQDSTRRKLSKK